MIKNPKTKSRKDRTRRHLDGPGHCQRMLSVFSDILDRGARARLCRRIEAHLRECPQCGYYVDTMRKTVVLYRSLGDEDIPGDVSRRLFKTIRIAEFQKSSAKRKKTKRS